MSGASEHQVSLVIRALDRFSPMLDRLGSKLERMNAPFKALGKGWDKVVRESGLGRMMDGFAGVGSAVQGVAMNTFALASRLFMLGAVAGVALFGIVEHATEAGNRMAVMSKRVGEGVDMYASLSYAAKQSDIDQDAFDTGMQKFAKNLGDAKANGGELYKFLLNVSPKLAEQFKSAKTVDAGFSIMTDAMTRLTDESKRAMLSTAAFGRNGFGFGDFLFKGGADMQRLQERFMRLAGSQEEFAQNSRALAEAGRDLDTAFVGLRASALAPLMPVITKLVETITDLVVKNRDGIKRWAEGAAKAIEKWVAGGGVERLIDSIGRFIDTVQMVWEKVDGFKGVLIGLAAYLAGPLVMSILSVIPAVLELGAAILATPVGWVLLIGAAFALAAYQIYKNWGPISQWMDDLTSGWRDSLEGFVGFFQGTFTGDMTTAFQSIGKIVSGGSKFWATALDGLIESYKMLLAPMLKPLEWAMNAAGLEAPSFSFRQLVGVSSPVAQSSTPAKIEVNFSNLPKGTEVTQDSSANQSIDVSAGYSAGF